MQYRQISSSITFACALTIGPLALQAQTTWYVDDDGDPANVCASWADACPELQKALDLANSGDEIWVAEGTYKPDYDIGTGQHTGDRTDTFQFINGVAIYGGFDGTESSLEERAGLFDQTILSGDLNSDDGPDPFQNNGENSYHVTIGSWTDPTAVLDGFTIAGGNANGTSADRYGAGTYNYGGNPTITNCTFSGNSAMNCGGGMFNRSSSPTLTNCIFSGNLADFRGGGMHNWESSPTLTNCTFSGNTADDSGGGMSNSNSSSPTLTNCTFSGNSATFYGGGMHNWDNSSPTVTNCTFSANSAQDGRAVDCDSWLHQYPSILELTNCILWDGGDEIWNNDGSTITITYSDVQGGWEGVGNIDADPLFVTGPMGDNYLSQIAAGQGTDSPCVDTGSDTAVNLGLEALTTRTDEFGDSGTVDMGYHYPTPDCNGNGIPDAQDIAIGTSDDCDGNGIPDECDRANYGDVNGDGVVNLTDLLCLLDGFAGLFNCPGVAFEDLDIYPCDGGNGDINLMDIFAMLDALAGQPACPEPCP